MAATRTEISGWLDQLYANENYSHMIVVCDTFDYEDYPVYVMDGQDVNEVEAKYRDTSMQRVMEVYSRNHDKEAQLAERRAFHRD